MTFTYSSSSARGISGSRDVSESAVSASGVVTTTSKQNDLAEILKHLPIAVQAGDFTPRAVRWTIKLRKWLSLKFDPTKQQQAQWNFELALAPGIEPGLAAKSAGMFMLLTGRKHYLEPLKVLALDWRPLFRELKVFVIPEESYLLHFVDSTKNFRTLNNICSFA